MCIRDRLAGIHVFFPDPWPKKRHHKRRLLKPGFVHELARRLAPGSCCILHLTPTDTLPVVIGSDRHVTGAYVCDGVELDAEQSELTGTIGTMGDREASVFVLLPPDLRLRAWEGCEADLAAPQP